VDLEKPFGRRELLRAAAYGLVLVWLNAYVCRELFLVQTAWMNSMHGFWIALAERAGDSWFHATWWPYWDCGIPFEFTYAPLIPAMTELWSALRGVPHALAFNVVTGVVYCAGPLTLFLMAWLLTRLPGYSFAAALFYSFTAPTQLFLPDSEFSMTKFWDARRLFVIGLWDETPHLAALALLPLAIVFLSLAIRKRRFAYGAAAVISISLMALASAFGPINVAMAALCLLFVLRREHWKRNVALTAGIGAFAWAICAPYYSPSLLHVIVASTGNHFEGKWDIGSLTTMAMVAVGWVILWRYLPRWTADWRLQFFALFAYLTSSVPMIAAYLHHQFLPQPTRYKLEMELALAPLVVFAARHWFEKAPAPLRNALLFLLLALAGEQLVSHRRFGKVFLHSADVTQTIEYRAATWAEQHLPGVRVMMPGSIGQWANAFTGLHQFSGSSWSMTAYPVQQRGLSGIYNGAETPELDAMVSLAWLKAFGVGAIAVSGPKSEEYWKQFAHPEKFEGVLPALWSEKGVTIYQVPQRTASLAHVVPEADLVRRVPRGPADITAMARYVADLDDPSLPLAELQWEGPNRIRIRTTTSPGQAISIQVSSSPGWRATAAGHERELKTDALGLMWVQPERSGPCEVELTYDGGWELRLCRWISFTSIIALLGVSLFRRRGGRGQRVEHAGSKLVAEL